MVTHFVYSQEPDVSRFGWAKAGKMAFEEAGLSPADMDIAEIYDSYPIFQIIGFEELGFCRRGEAGEIFLRGETWPGGDPCTTNGGMLSQGHTGAGGAVALMVETARQLMGKGGIARSERRFAVETAVGGTYMEPRLVFWVQNTLGPGWNVRKPTNQGNDTYLEKGPLPRFSVNRE
jgi:acetyl-CoA acetyltransferase